MQIKRKAIFISIILFLVLVLIFILRQKFQEIKNINAFRENYFQSYLHEESSKIGLVSKDILTSSMHTGGGIERSKYSYYKLVFETELSFEELKQTVTNFGYSLAGNWEQEGGNDFLLSLNQGNTVKENSEFTIDGYSHSDLMEFFYSDEQKYRELEPKRTKWKQEIFRGKESFTIYLEYGEMNQFDHPYIFNGSTVDNSLVLVSILWDECTLSVNDFCFEGEY